MRRIRRLIGDLPSSASFLLGGHAAKTLDRLIDYYQSLHEQILEFYRVLETVKDGDKGDKGDKGDVGPQGIQGIQDPKGDTGEQGPIGPQGEQGIKGEKGDIGEKGDKGDKGDKGEKGDAGTTDYNDLINKPTIPVIPTNISYFTNDTGYLTEHQSLANYALKSELFSGSYNDLTDKPTIPVIPTNVSTFTNDAGYITEQYLFDDLAAVAVSGDYADIKNTPEIPTIPTRVSFFKNDAGYLTQHQDISGKADKSTTYTKTEVDGLLSDKQDTINDIAAIRSGAALGATAYQKPQNGIPASDLANDVIPTVDYPVTDVKSPNGNSIVVNKIATIPNVYMHNLAITGDGTTSIFATILTSFNTPFDITSLIAYINNLNSGGFVCSGTVRTNSSGIAVGRTAVRLIAGNSTETIGIIYHDTGDAGTAGPIYYSAGTGANKISSVSDTVIPVII